MTIFRDALPLLKGLQDQMGERKLPIEEEDSLEESGRAVLHWVKKKYGSAKMAAHRAFVKMVRKNPAAHRRQMRQNARYHRLHKWHDKLMKKTSRPGWVRRHIMAHVEDYEPYCEFGCQAFYKYLEANPDLNSEEFGQYVTAHNRADRDSGELEDIASDEIARLGQEFAKTVGLEERDPGQAFMDLPFELRVTERGRGLGPGTGEGPGGKCVCPKCGHTATHKVGQPCLDEPCPECGTTMIREESDPESMKVQTLLFSKDRFSRSSAVKWAKSHGFKATKVDEKENTFRLRQRPPSEFETFRTITFKPGIKAVVAKV